MTTIPTRWRTALEDQLQSAIERSASARRHFDAGNASAAMQEAYPAAVAAATIRAWHALRPWERSLQADELHKEIFRHLPGLFAALAEGDVQGALTSPWRLEDARAYVDEVGQFVADTNRRVEQWTVSE